MKAKFRFKLSYLNTIDFEVWDSTGHYVARYRTGTSQYEQSIYNGDAAEYARCCAAVVGYLESHSRRIPRETVAAYNEWCEQESREANAKFDASPEKYGWIAPDHELRRPRFLAKGAAHWRDGWQFEPIEQLEAAAA
jgi:hypothetical protein